MQTRRACRPQAELLGRALPGAQRRSTFLVVCAVLFVPATFLDRLVVFPFRMLDNPATILGLLMAGFFAVSWLRRMRLFRGPAGLAFLFLAGATAAWLAGGQGSPGALSGNFPFYFQYVQVFGLFLIFIDTCRDLRALRGVAIAMFISCSLMSLLANLGFATVLVESHDYARSGVGALNLNLQAFLYALCLIGFFGWCLARWPRLGLREWVMTACSVSMLVAAVRTGSRGGLVMLLLGLALALLLFLGRRRMLVYFTLVPLVLTGVFYIVSTSNVVQARYAHTLQGDTGMRMELTESGWRMFLQKPGFGWGAGYAEAMGDFVGRGRRMAVHNTYLQILVSFGLIGFLPWFSLLVFIGYRLWCLRRLPLVKIGLVLYLSTLVFSLVGNNGYSKVFWILLALLGVLPELVRAPALAPSQVPHAARVRQLPGRVSGLNSRHLTRPPRFQPDPATPVVNQPPGGGMPG